MSKQAAETDSNGIQLGGRALSRCQIANITGLSLSYVSRIFSGKRTPSVYTVRQIAQAVGVSEQEVIDELQIRAEAMAKRRLEQCNRTRPE